MLSVNVISPREKYLNSKPIASFLFNLVYPPIYCKLISGTSSLNHGTIDTDIPKSSSVKLIFEGFQCIELASADVATPTSPIAPDLESGEINRKGTAVVIVFKLPPKTSS